MGVKGKDGVVDKKVKKDSSSNACWESGNIPLTLVLARV